MSNSDSGYMEDNGFAQQDQLKAAAMDHLRAADSFVLVAALIDEDGDGEVDVKVLSAVNTPFAPHFLAQVSRVVSQLVVDSIEDINDMIIGDEPEA